MLGQRDSCSEKPDAWKAFDPAVYMDPYLHQIFRAELEGSNGNGFYFPL